MTGVGVDVEVELLTNNSRLTINDDMPRLKNRSQ